MSRRSPLRRSPLARVTSPNTPKRIWGRQGGGNLIMYRTQIIQLVRSMRCSDLTHRSGKPADDQTIGHNALAFITYAAQEFAIRDAGCGKENIFGGDEVFHQQYFVEVIAGFMAAAQLIFITRV